MQTRASRVVFLASACGMAVCYLILGAVSADAQAFPACNLTDAPPCHRVKVGPPTPQNPLGDAHFEDVDSGSRSNDIAGGPVITVIRVGETLQWEFFYAHSSTSGICDSPLSLLCNPNGTWDSTIRANGTHRVTFNQPGVFTYFCQVHFSAMRGMVVVLNGPDYNLFATDPTFISTATVTPTLTIFAGDNASFTGDLVSYLGFVNTLSLTCANGDPRNPGSCPTTPTTVVPSTSTVPGQFFPFFTTKPFSFPISEATGGEYLFDVLASPLPAGTPQPNPSPFSHRKTLRLRVNDLGLTPLADPLTGVRGANLQTTVQAKSLGAFAGNITSVTCSVTPAGGPNCAVSPTAFALGTGSIQNLTVTLTNTASVEPTNYSINLVATSSAINPGPGAFTRAKSFTLGLKAAERFDVTISPPTTTVSPGAPFTLLVRALNAAGNVIPDYDRTVHFTSTDPAASFQSSNLKFEPSDNGVKIFSITLNSVGPRIITVADDTPTVTSGTSPAIRVEGSEPADNDIELVSSRAPDKDAYFRNANVTFTATVTAASGTPVGNVRFFNGTVDLGTAALTGSGSVRTASKTFPQLPVGDYAITAVFEPTSSSGFTANVSTTVLQRRYPSPRCVNDVCPGSH